MRKIFILIMAVTLFGVIAISFAQETGCYAIRAGWTSDGHCNDMFSCECPVELYLNDIKYLGNEIIQDRYIAKYRIDSVSWVTLFEYCNGINNPYPYLIWPTDFKGIATVYHGAININLLRKSIDLNKTESISFTWVNSQFNEGWYMPFTRTGYGSSVITQDIGNAQLFYIEPCPVIRRGIDEDI